MKNERFHLVLRHRETMGPGLLRLLWERAEGSRPWEFIPGQFVTLWIPEGEGFLSRSYSIASFPGESVLELVVSCVPGGVASAFLSDLALGSGVAAVGPVGRLVLEEPIAWRRIILVATGTGVVPYRSMLPRLQAHLAQHPECRVVLLLGARSEAELIYGLEFQAWAQAEPRFSFLPCLSRAAPGRDFPQARGGYVQEQWDTLDLDPSQDGVYLCGNPNMIDAAFSMLKERGFCEKNVRREKYLSPRRAT